ncbi:hypothetical protein [Lewinella sp. IMCC34183]|uniref:hypothetical protein n=1 Tax=Lewinella sp. IMCC34183 TaxID=2248762 RepID=UPI000E27D02C|nr:hypothetical protein [Lewinella sp. IMCC34183]
MGKQQTKQQIKTGIGAPFLRKKPFGKAYDEFLLKGCFRNYAYDPQSEGNRGWYSFQLLRRSKHYPALAREFRRRFLRMKTGDHRVNPDQAFAVAYHLYRAGDLKKGPIIDKYRELNAEPNPYEYGWAYVIRLGRKGMYAYMEVTGKQLKGEKVTAHSPEIFRKKAVRKALKKWGGKLPPTSRENKHVRRYRRKVLDRKAPPVEEISIARPENFDELIDHIEAGRPGGRLNNLYQRLTPDELRQLAERELRAKDPAKKWRYLRVFEQRDYPGDPLRLIDRLDLDDRRLLRTVSIILGRVASVAIRRFARSRLKQHRTVAASVRMLTACYSESDDALIYRTIRDVTDQGELHAIGDAVQGILKRHPDQRMHRTIGYLYANGRCGVCRREFLLHQRAAAHLTKRRRRELRWDSYAPTRSLV